MRFQVQIHEQGVRLDVLLTQKINHLGRSGAKRLIEEGRVHVNGKRHTKGYFVQSGDEVEIENLENTISNASATPDHSLKLNILFEDEQCVCVEKPQNIASHPLRPGEINTVASALLAKYPEMKNVGYSTMEPGILHRLDIETSGVMLAAKNASAFDTLKQLQKQNGIQKTYLALCQGPTNAPQAIDVPIRTDPSNRKKMMTCDHDHPKALHAETLILSSKQLARSFQLNTIQITNGRRHQIRAHLAYLGFPLAGDLLYEGPKLDELDRLFLHAHKIEFQHPMTSQKITVTSTLPDDLKNSLVNLEN